MNRNSIQGLFDLLCQLDYICCIPVCWNQFLRLPQIAIPTASLPEKKLRITPVIASHAALSLPAWNDFQLPRPTNGSDSLLEGMGCVAGRFCRGIPHIDTSSGAIEIMPSILRRAVFGGGLGTVIFCSKLCWRGVEMITPFLPCLH